MAVSRGRHERALCSESRRSASRPLRSFPVWGCQMPAARQLSEIVGPETWFLGSAVDQSYRPPAALRRRVQRIEIHMGGSGALDNLVYNVLPVPSSVWLFGTAFLGFIGSSRRNSV